MKHFLEFTRTGQTFADRIGEPEEIDAAFGRIALGFSLLEDMLRGTIQILLTAEVDLATIVTAELSSRQLVDVLGSLGRRRIETIVEEAGQDNARGYLDEVLRLCRKSEELRNTYFHSSYSPDLRVKTTAKASRGLRTQFEKVDSSLLLDVADFISETAWICQELPVGIGFADEANGNGDTVSYFRSGRPVGSFTLPGASAQPNKRLQPAALKAVTERRG
jgi:hypothetical protein